MAAAVFLLVIFSSSFRSVLPSTIEDNTRKFKNCLPLYCGNTKTINTVYTNITRSYTNITSSHTSVTRSHANITTAFASSSTNITLPSSCEPFSVVNCDDGPPLDIRLTGGVGAMLYDFESISNVSLSFINKNKEFEEYMRIQCHNCRSAERKCEAECVGANGNEVVKQEPRAPKRIEGNDTEKWLIIAPSAIGVGIIAIAVYCCARRLSSYKSKDDNCIKEFLKNYGPLPLKRYSYSEVKKMTWSFKDRLGQGGYGSVFKGKLPDGCLVAVKVLEKSKGNGAEFINEVASISRTSYVNIVTLLGFCFDGSKRALIYEFMPNGSLDKYIYKENAAIAGHQLDFEKLYQIALGVARGLEYLHRGCNTRILHFDIKPQNILLDENFCPKISDFGLAKICPKRESNISMKDARGTIGYIAPEVFYRNFGRVSHKSDVYSYGMLVLEMIGGRQSPHIVVDNTSEFYFPDWIHKRLEFGEELGLPGIDGEEENNVARKMVLVSLWCIQTNPLNRPPMNIVVEMLQASLESLPIPPRPYMSSPPRAPEISGASSHLLSSELLDS